MSFRVHLLFVLLACVTMQLLPSREYWGNAGRMASTVVSVWWVVCWGTYVHDWVSTHPLTNWTAPKGIQVSFRGMRRLILIWKWVSPNIVIIPPWSSTSDGSLLYYIYATMHLKRHCNCRLWFDELMQLWLAVHYPSPTEEVCNSVCITQIVYLCVEYKLWVSN